MSKRLEPTQKWRRKEKALIEEMSRRPEAAPMRSQDTPKASKVIDKMHEASDNVEKKHITVSKVTKTSKPSPNASTTATCPVCDKAVVDRGRKSQDSIFCEGLCQAWLHRCCAGLGSVRFAQLCNDSEPFHCPSCMSVKLSNDLVEANNALAAMALEMEQLRKALEATKKRDQDISDLQEAVKHLTDKLSGLQQYEVPHVASYASITAGGKKRQSVVHKQPSPLCPNPLPPGLNTGKEECLIPHKLTSNHVRHKARVRVVGARRIWGTMRNCTTKSVRNAINHVCKIDKGIYVKRKFFENPATGKFKWWFTLHGNESLLNDLESKWPSVHSQTMWKLEPCFKSNLYVQQPSNSQPILPGGVEPLPVGTAKGSEDVVITCTGASPAAELKCSEGGKGDKETNSGNVFTSVEGVAVAGMDGQSTSSVLVVHDSGTSQRDPVDDVATMHLDRSAVSTLSSSSLSALSPSPPDQSAFLQVVGGEGAAITTNTQATLP